MKILHKRFSIIAPIGPLGNPVYLSILSPSLKERETERERERERERESKRERESSV